MIVIREAELLDPDVVIDPETGAALKITGEATEQGTAAIYVNGNRISVKVDKGDKSFAVADRLSEVFRSRSGR